MSGSVDNRSLPHAPQASAYPSPSSALLARLAAPSPSVYTTSSLEPESSSVDNNPGCLTSCFECLVQTIKDFIAWICCCCFGALDKAKDKEKQPVLSQEPRAAQVVTPPPAPPLAPLKALRTLPPLALKTVFEDTTQSLSEERVQAMIDALIEEALTPESFKELFERAAARACTEGSVSVRALMKNNAVFHKNDNNPDALASYQLQLAMIESESADSLQAFIDRLGRHQRHFGLFAEVYPLAKRLVVSGKEIALDVLLKNRARFPAYNRNYLPLLNNLMDQFLNEDRTNFKTKFPLGPQTRADAAFLTIMGKHAPQADELLLFVIETGVEDQAASPNNLSPKPSLCLDVVRGLLEAPTTVINPQIVVGSSKQPLCVYLANCIEYNSPVGKPTDQINQGKQDEYHREKQVADYCRTILYAVARSQKVDLMALASEGVHAISMLAVRCDRIALNELTTIRQTFFDLVALQELRSFNPRELRGEHPISQTVTLNSYFKAYRYIGGYRRIAGENFTGRRSAEDFRLLCNAQNTYFNQFVTDYLQITQQHITARMREAWPLLPTEVSALILDYYPFGAQCTDDTFRQLVQ